MMMKHIPGDPTPDEIKQLLQEAVLRNYPNPARKGCPVEAALRTSAALKLPEENPHWNHISHCSPCYREFLGFRKEVRRQRNRYVKLTKCAIIGAVLALVIVSLSFVRG